MSEDIIYKFAYRGPTAVDPRDTEIKRLRAENLELKARLRKLLDTTITMLTAPYSANEDKS